MKLVAPKLSYIEKTSFEECLKKMKFQDVHIDQNIQQRTIIQDLTFDGCLFENIDFLVGNSFFLVSRALYCRFRRFFIFMASLNFY